MKLLLVEDDETLRGQLQSKLGAAGYDVDVSADGEDGLFCAREYIYDLAIVDIGLPKLCGISLIKQLREEGYRCPVLVLTARSGWQDKVHGLNAGADDYLVKPFQFEELIARIQAMLRRSGGYASSELQQGAITLNIQTQDVWVNEVLTDLTAFEQKLLEYFMLHPQQVVSKSMLGDYLYDEDLDRDKNSIEVLVGRLRRKIDPDNTMKPIETYRNLAWPWISVSIKRFTVTSVSLRKRFFVNTAFVLIMVMLVSAVVVDILFRKEIEKSSRMKMKLHVYTLLAVTEHNNSLSLPVLLPNPEFNRLGSGLIAWVLDQNSQFIWKSLSIETPPPAVLVSGNTGEWEYSQASIDGAQYQIAAYKLAWEDTGTRDIFHFVVAHRLTDLRQQIFEFRVKNTMSFVLVTFSLLVCQFVVLRFAFQPIRDLEREIVEIEKGKQQTLSNDYPQELLGVSQNLNALIEKEHSQREKYRTSMADLAHSLKTPIAIINIELEKYASNESLRKALHRVNQTIEYQLRRAVISGHSLIDSGTKIDSVFDMVISAVGQIHRDRSITVTKNVHHNDIFYGDENDLVEVFGNLLDNAYKYAKTAVHISSVNMGKELRITIEDDGDGVSKHQIDRIFSRGERLDRKNLGQGIGLAIVVDIVSSYGGSIVASSSEMGGARFDIKFPLKD